MPKKETEFSKKEKESQTLMSFLHPQSQKSLRSINAKWIVWLSLTASSCTALFCNVRRDAMPEQTLLALLLESLTVTAAHLLCVKAWCWFHSVSIFFLMHEPIAVASVGNTSLFCAELKHQLRHVFPLHWKLEAGEENQLSPGEKAKVSL